MAAPPTKFRTTWCNRNRAVTQTFGPPEIGRELYHAEQLEQQEALDHMPERLKELLRKNPIILKRGK
jgi:hypothetical protein